MPYFLATLHFDAPERAAAFFAHASAVPALQPFQLELRDRLCEGQLWDPCDYTDDEDSGALIRGAIDASMRLLEEAAAFDVRLGYVPGHDSKYCSSLLPLSGDDLLIDAWWADNWVGVANLLEYELSAWYVVVDRARALQPLAPGLDRRIGLGPPDAAQWAAFVDQALSLLQGRVPSEDDIEREVAQKLYHWLRPPLPGDLLEALTAHGFRLEHDTGRHCFLKRADDLPTLWGNYVTL